MDHGVRILAEVQLDSIHCSALIYLAGHTAIEGCQLGPYFPLHVSMLTQSWQSFFSPSVCIEMTSRMSCAIIFAGMEVSLTGLRLPESSSLPVLKSGVIFAFLQSYLVLHDLSVMESSLSITSASSLSTCGSIPSGPIDLCVPTLFR